MQKVDQCSILFTSLISLAFCVEAKSPDNKVLDMPLQIAQPGLSRGNITGTINNISSEATTEQQNQVVQHLWSVLGAPQGAESMLSAGQIALANLLIAAYRHSDYPALLTLLVPVLVSLLQPLIANIIVGISNAVVATTVHKKLLPLEIRLVRPVSTVSTLDSRPIIVPSRFYRPTNRLW